MNQITVEELYNKLQIEKDLHVLDVREQEDYEQNNIGAQCWPLSKLKVMDADGLEGWKNKEIIVHCNSGKRSMQACLYLETMGFQKVTNLQGGIQEWQQKYGDEKLK